MEENKIETPLPEVDSNVTTEETVVVNETESNDPSSELDGEDVVEAFENDPDVQKLKSNEEELISLMANPDVMRAYKAAKRVGERRQVSKKENKKKKAKRRMAKKSKR